GFRQLLRQQLSEYQLFRLALDEPGAVRAYEEAVRKGGTAGAAAAVDRAAADWLRAGPDTAAQSQAFAAYRSVVKGPGQKVSWQLWSNLLNFNPPASAAIGTPVMSYLKPFCMDVQSRRMWNHFGQPVVQMELEGKPLTLRGTLLSGGDFSTAAWK